MLKQFSQPRRSQRSQSKFCFGFSVSSVASVVKLSRPGLGLLHDDIKELSAGIAIGCMDPSNR